MRAVKSSSWKSLAIAGGLVLAAGATQARAEAIYGLTNLQQIVTFDSDTRAVTSTISPAGFSLLGEILLSIDVRPATGELYGLSNQGGIFKINPTTGSSTKVGATLSPAPAGNLRAIDFNPTVDRIRLLTSNGTNLRIHPDTGAATTDGTLAFNTGDPNFGDTPAVVNGAYTNSRRGATSTTLYDLDATNDVVATQAPPNDGKLNTVGNLGFDLGTSASFTGFDVSGATNVAYLVGNNLLPGGLAANTLYSVNLSTGAAASLGAVSGVNGSFRDIAVANVVPEPTTLGLTLAVVVGRLLQRRSRRHAS